jgi:Protein of unknown function (DUF3294)
MTAHHLLAAALPSPTNDQLVTQMQKIQQQMQQHLQHLQHLQHMQQQMQQQLQVGSAWLWNAWCYRLEEPIKHFANAAGQQVPQCLPATFGALDALNSNNCTTCLQYYGLPQHGTAIERRRRLAEHLGVNLNHHFRVQEDKLEAMCCRQRRAEVQFKNSSALDGADVLFAFPNDNGDPAPQSFPRTLQDLFDLSDHDLMELNNHYGLEEGGTMRRLALFLGVESRLTLNRVV